MKYLAVLFHLCLSVSFANSSPPHESFLQCTSNYFPSQTSISQEIHTAQTSSYSDLWQSFVQNLRFLNSTLQKPLLIITPFQESQVLAAVLCCRKHGLQIRVLSGGHDYEGLSYLSDSPFIIVDLVNIRSISVDLDDETAWVQSGATLGEIYYRIAEKSRILGFPAGICHTVGVGGHFSGGGFGTLLRKYGLAADNVIDARLVDVNGRLHDRKSMGEDLFWAIRGGGGASFGIILSWKIRLVRVPPTVTVFNTQRTLDQGAGKLVHRWQYIAHKLHEDLFIRVIIQNMGDKTIQVLFNSLFLGGINDLIPLMKDSFPELGLQAKDCIEMSWIESVLYFSVFKTGEPMDVLLNRTTSKRLFKAKSDFVREPIPETAFKGLWSMLLEEDMAVMIMDPYGGRMNEISKSEIPFPHRKGIMYNIQYLVMWDNGNASMNHIQWIRSLFRYMSPYVTNSPRAAYLNYRDLDLGYDRLCNTTYTQARVWGTRYFKNNFKRLAHVKGRVDPENFFRDEQSIPPLIFSIIISVAPLFVMLRNFPHKFIHELTLFCQTPIPNCSA